MRGLVIKIIDIGDLWFDKDRFLFHIYLVVAQNIRTFLILFIVCEIKMTYLFNQ